jgi:glycerol kinase
MQYVLALDQGTTSSRAILFDQGGRVRASSQREFRQIFPKPGWVEHDPEDIWKSQLACARAALRAARVDARRVAAIGIANQRETVVVWDRASGEPVHNAIVWQDRRTAARCERLKRDGSEALLRARTGLLADPYFSATKVEWLLETIPGLRLHAERGELALGTIDSWLAWKLSGGSEAAGARHVTDPTNASRTLLYDIHKGEWDEELLRLFRIPRAMLPEVVPSSLAPSSGAGVVAQRRWLGAAIPVAGIAGDQQAALFGQACHAPGMAKNTYGTGCFMLLNTGAEAMDSGSGLLTTAAAAVPRTGGGAAAPAYALEGSVFIGGAVVQWLRDGLGVVKRAADIEQLAASVDGTGGVFLVPAFTGLGAPYWDPDARGTIVGLTRGSTAAHVARAALESIAYQSAELLAAMQQDARTPLRELRVDGGASANRLLMQFQADLLGVPVVRPKILETTALGAAFLAGLATGVWRSRAEIARQWQAGARFTPRIPRAVAAERLGEWRRAVERSRGWARG